MTLFDFRNYGTFTGPGKGDYNFDDSEPIWHQRSDLDRLTRAFDLRDIGVLFFNNPADYAYFHCAGTSTSMITFERNVGSIPVFNVDVSNTKVKGNVFVNGSIRANGFIWANGRVNLSGVGDVAAFMQETRAIANTKKSFDISHPTKENYRLRYVCLEGPFAEVYFRGKLKNESTIQLPEYWANLVSKESIGVVLTPIGCYQELFVDRIQNNQIFIHNSASGPIHCSYVVFGERIDVERNISEYYGISPNDYPGNNEEYVINGV